MDNRNNSLRNIFIIGAYILFIIVFIILKLFNVIQCSWLWVLMPIWAPIMMFILLFVILCIVGLSIKDLWL